MTKVQPSIAQGIALADASGFRPRLLLTRANQVMSWLPGGYKSSEGSSTLAVTSGARNGVIEVMARENPYTRGKRERRVMLELTREQAVALRDFLNEKVS